MSTPSISVMKFGSAFSFASHLRVSSCCSAAVETKWLDAGQHARIEIYELGALEVTVER